MATTTTTSTDVGQAADQATTTTPTPSSSEPTSQAPADGTTSTPQEPTDGAAAAAPTSTPDTSSEPASGEQAAAATPGSEPATPANDEGGQAPAAGAVAAPADEGATTTADEGATSGPYTDTYVKGLRSENARYRTERNTARDEIAQLRRELTTLRTAHSQGIDADRLLDSRRFTSQLDTIDPTSPDYDQQVAAAIDQAAQADPALLIRTAPPASGTHEHQGTTSTDQFSIDAIRAKTTNRR